MEISQDHILRGNYATIEKQSLYDGLYHATALNAWAKYEEVGKNESFTEVI